MGRFPFGGSMYAIAASILVLSWLMPLHFLPWVSWHSEGLSFFVVLILAWGGLLGAVKKDLSGFAILPVAALPFMILASVALIQWIVGLITFEGDAFVFGLYLALCVACLTLGYVASRRTAVSPELNQGHHDNLTLTLLAFVLLFGAFASAVVALAQVFELWEHSEWINRMPQLRRPGGNLGQPNQLATLLLMGVASLMLLYESGKLKAFSAALIFLTLCIGLAATESRTGVLSFLILSGWWFYKRARVNFRLSPWIVGLACILLLVLFWSWPAFMAFTQGTGTGAEVNTKAGTRLIVWPQLVEAISQRPWLGWGLHEVPKAHNAVVSAYAASEPFSYSHNIVLDLALGMGVPLTVLLVLVTAVWLWRRVKAANHLVPWYCLALALPLAVHSMLEFPFAYAYFLVPVMFALGVLEAWAGAKPVLRIGVRQAAAGMLVISILAAWSVVEYLQIEADFRVARFEALHIGQTPPDHQRPKVILLTQLGALLDGARIVPKPGMSAPELELAKQVALRYPWTATQNRYALSLALNGNTEEAIRQMRVMRVMHGEKTYADIKANWDSLASDKYPQLLELKLP